MSVGKSSNKSSSSSNVWDAQAPYLQNLYGRSEDLYQQNAANPQNLVAGFTPTQGMGQANALNFAQNGAMNLGNQAQQAYGVGLNAADLNQNPYFGSALNAALRPITQNFMENVLPGIGREATMAGQPGSSRQGVAEGIASRGYLDAISGTAAGMANNAYGQGLNTMLGTLGQSGNVANMGLLPSSIMQDIGGQQQALQQQRLMAPFDLLGMYQNVLGAPVMESQSKGRGSSMGFSAASGG